eukprot:TRINITY_DN4874_c0_g1_i4.p1 TRINITY_DN4874_c0_g1~~TRINITY_DN4874_c0_g1_i4.p1  ORF type:complete len:255 (-),score=22.32 TRINITY_DN4874_c0_g1_i4:124-888(-)
MSGLTDEEFSSYASCRYFKKSFYNSICLFNLTFELPSGRVDYEFSVLLRYVYIDKIVAVHPTFIIGDRTLENHIATQEKWIYLFPLLGPKDTPYANLRPAVLSLNTGKMSHDEVQDFQYATFLFKGNGKTVVYEWNASFFREQNETKTELGGNFDYIDSSFDLPRNTRWNTTLILYSPRGILVRNIKADVPNTEMLISSRDQQVALAVIFCITMLLLGLLCLRRSYQKSPHVHDDYANLGAGQSNSQGIQLRNH